MKEKQKIITKHCFETRRAFVLFSAAYAAFISLLVTLHNREYVYAIYIYRSAIAAKEKGKKPFLLSSLFTLDGE